MKRGNWHKPNRWRRSVHRARVCVCGVYGAASGRSQMAVELSAPHKDQKQRLPESAHTHTQSHTNTMPRLFFLPIMYVFVWVAVLSFSSMHSFILTSSRSFLNGLYKQPLSQLFLLFSSLATSFCRLPLSPFIFLLFCLCHWHSQ